MNIKLLSVVSALIMSISLSSCGDNSGTAESTDNVSAKKAETWQTTTSATTTTAKAEVNELVYSSDKVKIYYTGGEKLDARNPDGYTALALDFRIENNYDEDIEWFAGDIIINGITITIGKYALIDANSTEACRFLVDDYDFEVAKIKEYNEVTFGGVCNIKNKKTYEIYDKNFSFTVKV